MKIEVPGAHWAHDDGVFTGGRHEIDKPSAKLLKAVAAAEAAGVIVVHASKDERAKMAAHVESQTDSEKAYASAQKDGSWQAGNLQAFVGDASFRLKNDSLEDSDRAFLEQGVRDAKALLAGEDVPGQADRVIARDV